MLYKKLLLIICYIINNNIINMLFLFSPVEKIQFFYRILSAGQYSVDKYFKFLLI